MIVEMLGSRSRPRLPRTGRKPNSSRSAITRMTGSLLVPLAASLEGHLATQLLTADPLTHPRERFAQCRDSSRESVRGRFNRRRPQWPCVEDKSDRTASETCTETSKACLHHSFISG